MQFRADLNYTLKDMRQLQIVGLMQRQNLWYIVFCLLFIAALLYFGYHIYLLLFIAILVGSVIYRASTSLKLLQAHGSISFTANEQDIRLTTDRSSSDLDYSVIESAVHRKDVYFLFVNKKQAYILPERCFTEGDPAAFGSFIEEKTGLKIKEIK